MGFKKYLKDLPKNSGFLIWSWIQLILKHGFGDKEIRVYT